MHINIKNEIGVRSQITPPSRGLEVRNSEGKAQ